MPLQLCRKKPDRVVLIWGAQAASLSGSAASRTAFRCSGGCVSRIPYCKSQSPGAELDPHRKLSDTLSPLPRKGEGWGEGSVTQISPRNSRVSSAREFSTHL